MTQSLWDLNQSLQQMPIIFVGGKGGVGKTTTAAALAVRFAASKERTLLISTDPAHSLGDVFDTTFAHQKTGVTEYLDVIELDPDFIIDEHFAKVERTISGYANPDMLPKIREHLQLSKSAPGAQEAAMLEAICRQLIEAVEAGYDHVIFDTAPTGHTLRLLVLPEMMEAWTDGLLTQQRRQAKLKSAADHLTPKATSHSNPNSQSNLNRTRKAQLSNPFAKDNPSDRWSQAVEVLSRRKNLFKQSGALLHDTAKTAVVLVMTADTLPIAETYRAVQQLKAANLTPKAIVINQLIQANQSDPFSQQRATRQHKLLLDIQHKFTDYSQYKLYLQQSDIIGIEALRRLSDP